MTRRKPKPIKPESVLMQLFYEGAINSVVVFIDIVGNTTTYLSTSPKASYARTRRSKCRQIDIIKALSI